MKATAARAMRSARKTSTDLQDLAAKADQAARLMKMLGNKQRLMIACFLATRGEMSAGELVTAVGISQSALSQHLAKMRADQIVAFRRNSQMLHYRLADQRAAVVLSTLKEIYCRGLK
jgi:ArsR family transcriptional regulator, virulence genes transcriptional regulator